MKLSATQVLAARDWIKDCLPSFRDLEDDESVDALTDSEIPSGIQEHYSGGMRQFIRDFEPSPVDVPAVSGCM